MDRLPLHIEYLLTRHDCVIVPGLGAFIATETEAYIDLEAGIIRPRRREISFNSSVVTDDGLLAHSIARRERLPYEAARRELSLLADRMRADLEEEGEVSIGMVGRLVKDAEGLLSFQPRRSTAVFDIMQDIRLSARNVSLADTAEDAAGSDSIDAAEAEDGMRTIRVKADSYVFTVSKRAVARSLHIAAMVVAILTIGLSLLMPVNHDNQEKAAVISIEDFFHHSVRTEALQLHRNDTLAVKAEERDITVKKEGESLK
ncbi:MAG: hypothetical protein K2I92_09975 [Muribaculaceae bacterium]|nr:hypothetical protein [Muribaculaceae bacterium]